MGPYPKHNIIVFGESGSGKSSVVNMIVGRDVAIVSDSHVGCTFKHKRYEASIGAFQFNIYDTAGLNEGKKGRVPPWEAVRELYTLIRMLDSVSLLVYCMRGRITGNTQENWILFHDVLCAKQVPTIVVETGVEYVPVDDLDNRSEMAKKALEPYEIVPRYHACIVAFRGPKNEYEQQYNSSQTRLQQLIVDYYRREPWSTTKDNWIEHIYETTYSTKLCFFSEVRVEFTQGVGNLVEEFIKKTGMTEDESDKLKSTLLKAETKLRKSTLVNAETRLRNNLMIRGNPFLSMPSSPKHNIILFGESGSGKSSIVNMIVGQDVAKVSHGLLGCTFEHDRYETSIFSIHDTAGLNEGELGRVPHWKAVHQLYTLIRSLDGVSLLVYCTRGRIKENSRANWTLFHKVLCAEKVPIIAVETGLEHEEDLDAKRDQSKEELRKYGLVPLAIACIVSFRGKNKEYEDLYNSSQDRLRQLIMKSYNKEPWSETTDDWIGHIYKTTYKTKFGLFPDVRVEFAKEARSVVDEYIEEIRMKKDEADQLKSTLLDAETRFKKRRLPGPFR